MDNRCMEKIICSGALFYTLDTNRFLFLHRARGKRADLWGLVGGTNEGCETPWEGLCREISEEIGFVPKIVKTIPLETFVSNDDHFSFHTYLCIVKQEFIPKLNTEHNGYAWVSFSKWPKPLHQGLKNTLTSKTNIAKLETIFKTIELLDL
jgi:8-oxo-dGTP pyrophosphatase MutT (NUDIX family)